MDEMVFGCHLKYANPGLTYMEGAISGGKNCTTGNNFEVFKLAIRLPDEQSF